METDGTGSTSMKLIKGQYRVIVHKYRKEIDLNADKEVVIKVFDLFDLVKKLSHKIIA